MATELRRHSRSRAIPAAALVVLTGVAELMRRSKRKRPRNLPQFRWLGDFEPLRPAERELLKSCADGKMCDIAEIRPTSSTDDNRVRGDFIRFLLLGGDENTAVHERGVWIRGAWIEGALDLECVSSSVFLALENCYFDDSPREHDPDLPDGLLRANDCTLPGLRLEGTRIRALDGDRMTVHGSVFLNHGFSAEEEVRLVGAQIGGNLDCDGGAFRAAEFRSKDDVGTETPEQRPAALRAEGAVIKGDILLGKSFSALGEVVLTGADVALSLTCSNGSFSAHGKTNSARSEDAAPEQDRADSDALHEDENLPVAIRADGIKVGGDVYLDANFVATGAVCLRGARIEGSLHCSDTRITAEPGQRALDAQRMVVKGKLDLRNAKLTGVVNLDAANIGTLVDNDSSWQGATVFLNGFHYDRISEDNGIDRAQWLNSQRLGYKPREFRPQPWEQIINTLRRLGHTDQATLLAIEKNEMLGRSGQMNKFRRSMHWLYGLFAGYGYRPLKTVKWIGLFWIVFSGSFFYGSYSGHIGPIAPAVYSYEPIKQAQCGAPDRPRWTSAGCPLPPGYPAFNPVFYSLDLVLPFVDLQQEAHWAPIATLDWTLSWKSAPRWLLRFAVWLEIMFGWLMGLLLLTSLGRVLNRE